MSFSRLGTPFHMLSCVAGREPKKVEEKCKKPSATE